MKLATLADGSADGRLAVVSKDLSRAALADGVANTMQQALETWETSEPRLRTLYAAVEAGAAPDQFALDSTQIRAPLPRAWQWLDASAYDSHGQLMQKVFKLDPTPKDRPLMYQGVSDTFYAATQDIPFLTEDDGIDFEGEFGVIVDYVPMGVTPDEAAKHIRLVVQINDWSLRKLAPIEMKTGFGWVQAKPPCSLAPVAVTPDELGSSWRDGRVDLPLVVELNGEPFGAAEGYPMAWSFPQLVAHAARTRALVAGTIIGSGTVSNDNYRKVGSSCIAERRGIELEDLGAPSTPYMRFGDRVRMEARTREDAPLFGEINQRVVRHD